MSLMNIMSVTLVVLILGAFAALFLGTRSSDAAELAVPVYQTPQTEMTAAPDAMNDRSSSYDIASAQ